MKTSSTSNMLKIALCGAHGTGKTTILKDLASLYPNTPVLSRSVRTFWEDCGVEDFEKLPRDIRTAFQKHQILNQLKREDEEGADGFLTDRSVIDYWGYTLLSSDMSTPDIDMYKSLVQARLKNYTHLIFIPIMFDAQNERLRADVSTRGRASSIMESLIHETLQPHEFLTITKLPHSERLQEITSFIESTQ
jgi:deoxyadenosine/deoxycytidine kinase